MNYSRKMTFASFVFIALFEVSIAQAQTFIDSPTVINYAINDNVAVGLHTSAAFTVDLISGGSVGGYLWGSGNSTIDVMGGTIASYLQADANGIFNLYGTNLALSDPTPYFTGTRYTLTGTLQDGQTLNTFAYQYDAGQFILHNAAVPEGSTLTLLMGLAVPGAGLLVRRRRKK